MSLVYTVKNVNDPPYFPSGIRPLNHTTFEVGDNITFAAFVDDSDIKYGQTLIVTWESNISGPLRELSSEDELEFNINDLPSGIHRITLTVTDREFQQEVWFELEVKERSEPPPEPPGENGDDTSVDSSKNPYLLILIVILVVAVAITVLILFRRSSKGPEEGE